MESLELGPFIAVFDANGKVHIYGQPTSYKRCELELSPDHVASLRAWLEGWMREQGEQERKEDA